MIGVYATTQVDCKDKLLHLLILLEINKIRSQKLIEQALVQHFQGLRKKMERCIDITNLSIRVNYCSGNLLLMLKTSITNVLILQNSLLCLLGEYHLGFPNFRRHACYE